MNYGSDLPSIDTGRSTARAGYSDSSVYAVSTKSANEILALLQSNIDVTKEAMKIAQQFWKTEKVTSAK